MTPIFKKYTSSSLLSALALITLSLSACATDGEIEENSQFSDEILTFSECSEVDDLCMLEDAKGIECELYLCEPERQTVYYLAGSDERHTSRWSCEYESELIGQELIDCVYEQVVYLDFKMSDDGLVYSRPISADEFYETYGMTCNDLLALHTAKECTLKHSDLLSLSGGE